MFFRYLAVIALLAAASIATMAYFARDVPSFFSEDLVTEQDELRTLLNPLDDTTDTPAEGAGESTQSSQRELTGPDQTTEQETAPAVPAAPDTTTAPGPSSHATQAEVQAEGVTDSAPAPLIKDAAAVFDVVRVGEGNQAFFAGTAPPDAQVEILSDGKILGQTQAGPEGDWVYLSPSPLPSGVYELTLVARSGDEVHAPDDVLILVVEEQETLAVVTPDDPNMQAGSSRSLTDAQDLSALALTIRTVDMDDQGQVTITGQSATPGVLQAYVNNELVGRTPHPGGTAPYRITGTFDLAAGEHPVRVDQVTSDGQVQARAEAIIYYDAPVSTNVTVSEVEVIPGQSLWRISRAVYGQGRRYILIYEANREQIADPDLIYPGQIFIIPDL